jgi:signal peptidase I
MTATSAHHLLRKYFTNAILSVPPVVYVRDNFYSLYVVDGNSMMPSLHHGDVVLVRKSDVYPESSWRRWTSACPSSETKGDDDDDDGYDDRENESRDALKVLALDASSGRPIGDKWTGRTYLRPPTVCVPGSVVVYRAPDAHKYPTGEYRIKRAVGLGGQLCQTTYRDGGGRGDVIRVPPFALWMEGDNNDYDRVGNNEEDGDDMGSIVGTDRAEERRHRYSSVDSRTYGPVCKNNIVGIAERIVWPPSRWGKIPNRVHADTEASAPRSWWV